ncbi:hypothetical protein RN001_008195 [Aquatica leii]|uniref:Uncharacterized protein n=1 Tax=Aquatica leii TaxID=1421715 RepID=A0AAN7SH64_9COLE|nr:hypothetical protein RN001_008195 [Aquatica leii]
MTKIARLRFNVNDDITLLQQVIAVNPFENERRWDEVLHSVIKSSGKEFSIRSIREHIEHLLKLFVKEDRANLRKSGTEEEYLEKERLLQEVHDLQRDFKPTKGLCRQRGNKLREDACLTAAFQQSNRYEVTYEPNFVAETIMEAEGTSSTDVCNESVSVAYSNSRESTPSKTTRKRTSNGLLKNSTLKLLQDRQVMEQQLKERELALIERKTLLEEKRFKLEEERWQLEKKEREAKLNIQIKEKAQQQAIIDVLLRNFR